MTGHLGFDPGIPTAFLWCNVAGDRYFLWDPSGRSTLAPATDSGSVVELVGFEGGRTNAPAHALGSRELAPDVVLETLASALVAALADVGTALAAIDPAFAPLTATEALRGLRATDHANLDLPAIIERLVGNAARDPASFMAHVRELEAPVATLVRIATFGDLARNLVARFGIAPDGMHPNAANVDRTPESEAAIRTRVGLAVRAELDARAAMRPPVADSFRFEDLIKAPT